jgi:hypothetical protein
MKRTLTIWITLVTLLLALAIPVLHTALAQNAPSQSERIPALPTEYRFAVNDLKEARKHLERAPDDGYGHRYRAMRMIDRTLDEIGHAVQLQQTNPHE